MKTIIKAIVCQLALCASAWAVPVTWTLNAVTFDDATTLSGSFVYDADLDVYSNWNLSTQAGASLPARTYTPANSFVSPSGPTTAQFNASIVPTPYYMRLGFGSALTNAGGTIALATGVNTSFECDNCGLVRNVVSGSVTTVPPAAVAAPAAIPTLSEWAMVWMACAIALWGVRRMRRP